ncbi:hypothetical protein SAZ11_30410 [Streptomyces sp. FXJ1.4098]|nr:hypothetical protein [Streptomyces sp. FXJ1.4098]
MTSPVMVSVYHLIRSWVRWPSLVMLHIVSDTRTEPSPESLTTRPGSSLAASEASFLARRWMPSSSVFASSRTLQMLFASRCRSRSSFAVLRTNSRVTVALRPAHFAASDFRTKPRSASVRSLSRPLTTVFQSATAAASFPRSISRRFV